MRFGAAKNPFMKGRSAAILQVSAGSASGKFISEEVRFC